MHTPRRRTLLTASAATLLAGNAASLATAAEGAAPARAGGPAYQGQVMGGAFADMYPVDIASTGSYYYVIDPGNYQIERVVRSSGTIDKRTPRGGGAGTDELAAARALAVDSAGSVYVADTPNNRVVTYDAGLARTGGWGKKGSGVGDFTAIYGVAIGPGLTTTGASAEVVYTIDGDRVQRFTRDGKDPKVFATGFNQPRQIEVNKASGDVYVVNARDRKIVGFDKFGVQKFEFGNGVGSGPGQFQGDPRGITATATGSLIFVTDDGNRRVQVWGRGSDGTYTYRYAIGSPTTTVFTDPRGLDMTPDGKLVVTDEWDYSLKEFTVTSTSAKQTRRLFGHAAGLPGANCPRGLAADKTGHLFTSDWWNQRIVRTSLTGASAMSWGKRGTRNDPGSLNFAWGVAVQPSTGRVFVANRESHEITVFDNAAGNHKWLTKWGSRGSVSAGTQLTFPQGLTFAADGTLYVVDTGNGRVKQFRVDAAGNGAWVRTIGNGVGAAVGQFSMPTGISVGADGAIWVADTRNSRVQVFRGGSWTAYGTPTGSTKAFNVPWGVTVAPDGYVWVADTGRKRLVRMSATGAFSYEVTGASAGTADFGGPFQVLFTSATTMYVSDTWGNRVIKLGW
ncbi:hypothetical protein [Nostocoides vanveenii]|jgi:tripartite motif-containing protein 71|uniref:NHL repeat containing protein n=1 Tax=Nostocoides vanveenii TaxID=330835 RepID=A0ABP4WC21_9MICO